jgi:rhamnosyltransferase
MVNIILATYNGEKYIEQQLLSLMAQTYTKWKCIIHDDGSKDKTVKIIKKYQKLDSRFVLIEDKISNKNAGKNFLHTLKFAKADYFCFCDQDDIWLDNKLQKLVNAIEKKDNSIPQVVFCNAYCWNCSDDSISGNATLAFPTDVESLLFLNCGIQGASAIFNKKMKDSILVPLEHCSMHDWYLTMVGCTFGQVDYIHENLMLYRQHSAQVTGLTDSSMVVKYQQALKRKNPIVKKNCLDSLKSFYSVWESSLNELDKKNILQFIQLENENFFSRLIVLLKGNWRIYNSKFKLIVKLFLRPFIGE